MYINTYMLSIAEDKKAQYLDLAQTFLELYKRFGAVEVFENWESDIPDGEFTDYRKAVQAKPGEKIILAWVIWPDRATADTAHKGMFEDTQMATLNDMPFDGKRMILGGFEPMLHFHKSDLGLV